MNYILLAQILYALVVILVCLRIIYDTRSITKTLAYLLLTIFSPSGASSFILLSGLITGKGKCTVKNIRRMRGSQKK